MELDEALRHAGNAYPMDLENRAREALPAYLWTWGKPKERRAYCSLCQEDNLRIDPGLAVPLWAAGEPYLDEETEEDESLFHHPKRVLRFDGPWLTYGRDTEKFTQSGRHKDYGTCPACGNVAQYRSLSMGRKTLLDRIFLIRYRKSAVEENALVMLGYLVIRDWGAWDDYNEKEPETYIDLREICVFRPGRKGERFIKRILSYGEYDEKGQLIVRPLEEWRHPKECVGGFDPWRAPFQFDGGTDFYLDRDSMDAALLGTPWESIYREWGRDFALDRITFFARAIRYACLEYLIKLGFLKLAYGLIRDELPPRLLYPRGKTAQKVLRVDGNFYGWLKGNRIDASPRLLELYHLREKKGLRLGNEQLLSLSTLGDVSQAEALMDALGSRTGKALRYIRKKGMGLPLYLDQLRMMDALGIPRTETAWLFPADFDEAHAILARRQKVKQDAEAAKKLAARAEGLSAWWYSALGLTIRPMLSPEEIIREGNALRHCVGTYVRSYAEGNTILLALREEEKPTTPWRTVEYNTAGQLVQCRGYKNQSPPDEQERIDQFLRMFDAYRKEYERLNGRRRAAKRKAA